MALDQTGPTGAAGPSGQPGQPDVVTLSRPRSPAAEAYRTLRTNLQLAPAGAPRRRLLLTSAGPGEGKSTALVNLAVVMAQAGQKVAVVDADLRRPSQHILFRLRASPGLSNLLVSPSPAAGTPGDDGAALQATTVDGLRVLTSGPLPPNPAELLGSSRMEEVLIRLTDPGATAAADVVLIDSPPVVPFSDAAVLSRRVDGVLLVVGAGTVKRDQARKAKAQLESVGAAVLGLVVMNVEVDSSAYATYYESEEAAPRGAASSSR
jgi:capsular exopolysaccharide synthesis family protein